MAPTLTTDRLTLRGWREDDLDAYARMTGDPEVMRFMGGTLDRADVWGMRKLAYEIRQRNEADYRFYRFQGEPDLLERLDHSLKITDGVLRFRIFKIDPDAPANPPPSSDRPAAVGDGRPERGDRERRPRREDRYE